MPRSRPPYPPEFRAEAVELIRSGTKSFSQLSRDLGVSDQTLRNWVRQVDVDTGRRHDGLTTSEREELRRLRAENRTLRMERDLLKKAAVFFAKDGDRSRCTRWKYSSSSTRRRPRFRSRSCADDWVRPKPVTTPGVSDQRPSAPSLMRESASSFTRSTLAAAARTVRPGSMLSSPTRTASAAAASVLLASCASPS